MDHKKGEKNPDEMVAQQQASLPLKLATIRRGVVRIQVILEASLAPNVYWMACTGTSFLIGSLIIAEIEPFGESLFFIGEMSLLVIKLLRIVDLENAFASGEAISVENATLLPIALVAPGLNRLVEAG